MSKISVIIPAYNEEKTIIPCIQSIQNQGIDFPYKITVINNASTDNTAREALRMGVQVISEQRKGLYYATAFYITFCQDYKADYFLKNIANRKSNP